MAQVTAGGTIAAVLVPDASAVIHRLAKTFYEDPASALTTVCVTGAAESSTATSFLIRAVLAATQQQVALLTPLGYALGALKLTSRGAIWEPDEDDPTRDRLCTTPNFLAPYRGKYEAPTSPPDVLGVQQLLAGCVDAGAETAVLAAPVRSLRASALHACRFDVAVWTGAGDGPAAEDDVVAAEALLAAMADPKTQRAVLCVDDGATHRLRAAASAGARALTYSAQLDRPVADGSPLADVYPLSVDLSIWDTTVTLATPLGDITLRTALVGAHAVADIAAAVTVGIALGATVDTIVAGVESVRGVPGQLESIDEGQPFAVIVDGARTPMALEKALKTVRDCGAQNVITVVGATAGSDKAFRAALGRMAHQLSDVLIVRTCAARRAAGCVGR